LTVAQNLITPILALELQGITFIIIIAIAIISWLTNLASQKNPPKPQPQARPPRKPAGDKLSQEIDVFLQEVSGRRKQSNPEPIEIEVVPDDEIRRRRSGQRAARSTQRPQRPVQPQRPKPLQQQTPPTLRPTTATPLARTRPGQEMAERHSIDPSQLGSNLQSHLATYMGADRLEREVNQHLKHEVDQGVSQHLGQFRATTTADAPIAASSTPTPQKAADIVRLLRDPSGVRQAILINEVLGKPLAMRQR
jgi:hypothetical protein